MNDDSYSRGWEEFVRIYKFAFKDTEGYGFYPGKMEIRKNISEICIRLCNESYFYTAGIMTNLHSSVIVKQERKSGPMRPKKGRNSDEHNYDFKLS